MALIGIAADKLIPTIKQALTASSGTLNIDLAQGQYVIITLSATVTTMTITNWPANTAVRVTLEVRNQGAFNITGWGGAKWAGGTAPTVTSGASKYDVFVLFTGDGGTTIYGAIIAQNCS